MIQGPGQAVKICNPIFVSSLYIYLVQLIHTNNQYESQIFTTEILFIYFLILLQSKSFNLDQNTP